MLRWRAGSLRETIQRLEAFERVGADVFYAPALPDLDSIRAVCARVTQPVNLLMGLAGSRFTVTELANVGVKRISVGSALARLSFGVFLDAAREIKHHGTFEFTANAIGFAELEEHFPAT